MANRMKKGTVFIKRAAYVFILLACVCASVFFTRRYDLERSENQNMEQEKMKIENDTEDIFGNNHMIDIGNHVVAYRIPADEKMRSAFDGMYSYRFSGSDYIAICQVPLDRVYNTQASIQYLPDDYGNIMEMRMEESGELYIRYAEGENSGEEEVWIPIYLPLQAKEMVIDVNSDMPPERRIAPDQEGLKAGEQGFTRTVWTECFLAEGHSYEVVFERVSPIYDLSTILFGVYADYVLSVKDETGDVISQQRLINFPIEYEEVHYMIDFSGDGFLDIAFCTYMYLGRNSSSDVITLIWDSETKTYEEKGFPPNRDNWDVWHVLYAFQTWNEEFSAISGSVGSDEYGHMVLERYSFVNGSWRRVGKMEPLYDENEHGETGEPICLGYHEVLYDKNREVIKENGIEGGIWLDEESVWSWKHPGNIKLYPEGMERMEVDIGGIVVTKYVMAD